MDKYRKKPIVVRAVRFTDCAQLPSLRSAGIPIVVKASGDAVLETLEGDMRIRVGDWIIRGVMGEHYPCKPDIFEATYEPVQKGGE